MFKMSHLGPHGFVSEDHHRSGHHWLAHFGRNERHHMIEDDRAARSRIGMIFFSVMMSGLVLLVVAVLSAF